MSPVMSMLFGGIGLIVSLSTLAVFSALVAAKRADEQAARTPMPLRTSVRRVQRSLKN